MDIKYAIVSSDESHYLDYWPIICDAWIKIGIEPVLVKISKDIDDWSFGHLHNHTIINLPQIPNIKASLQAQIGRMWAYKLLTGNCIMSDIDMFPISESYFKLTAKP